MVGTFALVLFFTMLKDAYEDLKRYGTQKELNHKQALVYTYKKPTNKKRSENKIKPKDMFT